MKPITGSGYQVGSGGDREGSPRTQPRQMISASSPYAALAYSARVNHLFIISSNYIRHFGRGSVEQVPGRGSRYNIFNGLDQLHKNTCHASEDQALLLWS